MKKITTKDLITLLPLGNELQQKLLSEIDSYSPDAKFEMEKILWGAYDALHEAKVEQKLEVQFEEALHGNRELDSDFYNSAEKAVEHDKQVSLNNQTSSHDLEIVRNKLQAIVQNS